MRHPHFYGRQQSVSLTFSDKRKPSAAQVKGLYQHAQWAKRRPAAAVAKALRHSDLLFSAWDGKALVGFCRVSTDFSFRAVIWDVIVHPDYFRQGIGARLVTMVIEQPKLKSVDGFWLFTTDKQVFYKKLGFKLYPKNLMLLRMKA